MSDNVIPFPTPAAPPCRWASESLVSGCSVVIEATGAAPVDRTALAAQLRDLADTVEGPLGRAFFETASA